TSLAALLACFAAFLIRHTQQTRFVIGCPLAERPASDLDALVRPPANVALVLVDASGDPSTSELIARIHAEFSRAARACLLAGDTAAAFDQAEPAGGAVVMFEQVGPVSAGAPNELGISFQPRAAEQCADLVLVLDETEPRAQAAFVFDTALFDATTV